MNKRKTKLKKRQRDAHIWAITLMEAHGQDVRQTIEDFIVLAGPLPENAITKLRIRLEREGRKMSDVFEVEYMGDVDIF
jgi:hypothetical protein